MKDEENKLYYKKNKLKENKRCREYYKKNIIQQRERCKKHKKDNRIHYTKYMREKRWNDINFLIASRLRRRLLSAFKGGKKKDSVKYGINYNAIILNLNNTIPKDYYENPKKYCMDHIIPLSYFDLTKDSEVRKAQSPENIQWITVEYNIAKRDRLDWIPD